MTGIGSLVFLSPWFLLALIILPVLWHIVRFTPPAPRRILFPAIKLLKFLRQDDDTPRRAPWWLLLMRLLLVVLVILAAAQPVLDPDQELKSGNSVILVINNDWAAAANWNWMQDQMSGILTVAARENKQLQIITTAPDPEATYNFITGILTPAEAGQIVKSLRPLPWPARYDLVEKAMAETSLAPNPDIFWFSDGVAGENFPTILQRLRSAGRVALYMKNDLPLTWLLARAKEDNKIELQLRRSAVLDNMLPAFAYTVRASGEDGRILAQKEVTIPAEQTSIKTDLELPLDLKNKISKLSVSETIGVGTTYLLDELSRQHPVGIISTQAMDSSKPLLDEHYFIERAISPFAEIYHGSIEEILKSNVAVILLTDNNSPSPIEREQLNEWVEKGGTLIRFAGENMAKDQDPLTPVPISNKPRSLTGNLSWSEPLNINPMPDIGPFSGLTIPSDIKVSKQLLSLPSPELASKTWASLADGTPLVTGETKGKGSVVLFHVAASNNWSNLVLSGLFVEMLQRLVWMSQGIVATTTDGTLSAYETLDGFGQLQSPPVYTKAMMVDELNTRRVSPSYPPGYYGSSSDKKAFNLSDHIPVPDMIHALPENVRLITESKNQETDLRPFLYLFALLLGLIDTLISLNLRGFIPRWRGGAAAIALVLLMTSNTGFAQTNTDSARSLRLAYVRTFSGDIDRTSAAGLEGLSQVLRNRTSVEIANPVGVNIDQDELAFYPLLYWPIDASSTPISLSAAQKVNAYLRNGGMVVIDTRDGNGSAIAQDIVAQKFQNVDLPPMNPISPDHVLTRSFYLLKEWPGRWADKTLWVAASEESSFDGVSSVILGTQDWAAAWAVDKTGKPLFSVVPGGDAQRETARRFGVNLVLYALTGNYKSDQVHVPAILERLGNER